MFQSELSGNVIDLCPVGALTSKPYAFSARPWELTPHHCIDVSDAVGSNFYVETKGRKIVRVKPVINEAVNGEWLTDKGRWFTDGLKKQRLTKPFAITHEGFSKRPWGIILREIRQYLQDWTTAGETEPSIDVIIGNVVDLETVYVAKRLVRSIGEGASLRLASQEGHQSISLNSDFETDHIFGAGLRAINDEEVDVILVVGGSPRTIAPIINAKLRHALHAQGKFIAYVGNRSLLSYEPSWRLGCSMNTLNELAKGTHDFCSILAQANNALIIHAACAIEANGPDYLEAIRSIEGTLIENFGNARMCTMHYAIGHSTYHSVGGDNILLNDGRWHYKQDPKLVIAIGTEPEFLKELPEKYPDQTLLAYMGVHGCDEIEQLDFAIPAPSFLEKKSSYVNTEGRSQQSKEVFKAPRYVREEWKALTALQETLIEDYPSFSDWEQMIRQLHHEIPAWTPDSSDSRQTPQRSLRSSTVAKRIENWDPFTDSSSVNYPIEVTNENLFFTDYTTRNSEVMGRAAKRLRTGWWFGSHGTL
jgi:NADH dehydrogenase/NADH:ubiquinone oxidoreductase subunit G